MSLIFTHTSENLIKAPRLTANTDTPWRGLPKPFPVSATWAVYPLSLTNDYYDLLSYGPNPFSGSDYWMAATLQGTGGPFWNLGVDGDWTGVTQIVSNQWYLQGFRIMKDAAGTVTAEYYTDLVRGGEVLTGPAAGDRTTYFTAPGSTHSLVNGDAPWAAGTAPLENWNGYIQGTKIWQAWLSPMELFAEAQSIWPVLPKYYNALWGILPMRVTGDYNPSFLSAANKRAWSVQSTTNFPVSGGPPCPYQVYDRTWWIPSLDTVASPAAPAYVYWDQMPRPETVRLVLQPY